jgi:xanthine dehydrogenase YagT iron-sulfur-binding subunit
MMKKKKPSPPDQRRGWSISRRGFLASAGTGAVCMAVSGRLLASSGGEETASVLTPDVLSKITLRINGRDHALLVEPRWTLLYVLREKLGLSGAKEGCGRGECGACTVLVDDIPRYACLTLAVEAEGADVTTVEGLMDGEALGPVQSAFVEEDAFQCGYCTPGQIMSVEGLLRNNPAPSMEEIRMAVSGNLCRCGAYSHIFKAASRAAGNRRR